MPHRHKRKDDDRKPRDSTLKALQEVTEKLAVNVTQGARIAEELSDLVALINSGNVEDIVSEVKRTGDSGD